MTEEVGPALPELAGSPWPTLTIYLFLDSKHADSPYRTAELARRRETEHDQYRPCRCDGLGSASESDADHPITPS